MRHVTNEQMSCHTCECVPKEAFYDGVNIVHINVSRIGHVMNEQMLFHTYIMDVSRMRHVTNEQLLPIQMCHEWGMSRMSRCYLTHVNASRMRHVTNEQMSCYTYEGVTNETSHE